MIRFRDRTFCSAPCKTTECRRNFTDETRQAAIRWGGGERDLVAFSDYSHDCPKYESLDEKP